MTINNFDVLDKLSLEQLDVLIENEKKENKKIKLSIAKKYLIIQKLNNQLNN